MCLGGAQGGVESLNSPREQLTINVLSQRVSGLHSLLAGRGLDQHLSAHSQPAMTQPVGHLGSLNPEELGDDGQRGVVCLREDTGFNLEKHDGGESKDILSRQYNFDLNFSRWLGCGRCPGAEQPTGS